MTLGRRTSRGTACPVRAALTAVAVLATLALAACTGSDDLRAPTPAPAAPTASPAVAPTGPTSPAATADPRPTAPPSPSPAPTRAATPRPAKKAKTDSPTNTHAPARAPKATPKATTKKPAPNPARNGYQVNRNPDGTITRWDPCRPITYRTNLTHAPSGAAADIRAALVKVTAATGLRFTADGTTTTIPTAATLTDPNTADLTIAWAPPGRTDLLDNATESARGGWQSTPTLDPNTGLITWRIVRGYVLLDTGDAATWRPGFGTGRRRGTLLLHELGHALGLNHTTTPGQVMNPQIGPTATGRWGAGDLAGLRAIGARTGCLP